MSRMFQVLERSPTLIASVQAGTLTCVGDFISQTVIEKKEKFDILRNARFGAIGFFMVGPVLRNWYGFLDKKIMTKSPLKTGVLKMLADQFLMAPVFLATFISINSLTQGNSLERVKKDVTSTYFDILISNYQLWPMVQMVNFTLVPLQYRILFVQMVAIAWNSYLSWKTNTASKEKTK